MASLNSTQNCGAPIQESDSLLRNRNTSSYEMTLPDARLFLRKRYLVGILAFFGISCLHMLKTNLSIAIVRMTLDKRVVMGNETVVQNADFHWSSPQKGFLLSIWYCGYFIAPFSGYIGTRFGFSTTFGLAVVGNAILALLSPMLIRTNMVIYIVVRVLEGVCGSTAITVFPCVFLYWSAPKDRCRMISTAHSGAVFGLFINYVMCGFIAENLGWEAVFYIPGGIALVWSVLWFSLVTNNPADDKLISKAEKVYLLRGTQVSSPTQKLKYPWKQMFTSKPVMAVCNEYFSLAWIYVFIMAGLPLYIRDTGFENMETIGLISSFPQLCAFIGELMYGMVADFLRSRSSLGINRIHKIILGLCQLVIATDLIVTSVFLDFTGSILALSLVRTFLIVIESSLQVLLVDAFGRYSGCVKGLCMMCLGVSALFSPILMGFITSNHTRSEWNFYILILSVFNIWTMIVFFFFGSGQLQPWANVSNIDNTKVEAEENRSESIENPTK